MIANELFDAIIRARLSGQEYAVLMFVIRMTYGYSRKEASCSCQEIGDATDMKRQHAHRIINKLSHRKVTVVTKEGDRSKQLYEINKNYDEWVLDPKKPTVTNLCDRPVTNLGDKTVTQEGDRDKIIPIIFKERKKTKKERVKKIASQNIKDFDIFWEAWPYKSDKKKAKKSWDKLKKSGDLPGLAFLLRVVCDNKKTESWTKLNGQFIPLPATWLNGERWNDEIKKDTPRQEEKNEPSKPVDMKAHLEN